MLFDRAKIGASFHKYADDYDRLANVQRRVVARLTELLVAHLAADAKSKTVLDVGCGTGFLLGSIKQLYGSTECVGVDLAFNMLKNASNRYADDFLFVNADAESLPFKSATFDLVLSASTLQWLNPLDNALRELRRVVKTDGLVSAAFFGGKSLWELHECYRIALAECASEKAQTAERLHRFISVDDLKPLFKQFGLKPLLLKSEIEMDYYPDFATLLKSIKGIGAAASSSSGNRAGGFGWRAVINRMSELYQKRFTVNDTVPITYEVIYFLAEPV